LEAATLNISPKGEVKVVGSIINELNELMRIMQLMQLPPSIYAAVESIAEFWVKFDRRNIEKEQANGTNRFPVEQLNKHEALLLILRDVRNELERATLDGSLKVEEWMKQYGVPPFFKNQGPGDEKGH
jgi:hypothetical protein